ncbi:MAG TPA: sigma-70 family RNA polymerase sigma factor [Gemmataceae bacterium]|nr:sigma-70 family RNA polymerase sigma factor [Gemmataceae bacterium]
MSTDALTDEALAGTVARRNESAAALHVAQAACRELYDRHARKLLAFLAGRLKPADVDDVHQEVWQRAWQHLPTGFAGGSFRSWLFAIARNCITDHLRRKKAEAIPDEGTLPDHRHRPVEQEFAEGELRDALAACLERLRRLDATLAELVRSRVAGESYEEFCARTGMAIDRAYRAFHHAKAQLQECVEKRVGP